MTDQERNSTPERKAYMKAYAEENRERINGHKKTYRRRHPEKAKESARRHRENSRDKKAEYYRANKEAIAAKNSEYHRANRDKVQAQQRVYRQANRDRLLLRAKAKRYAMSPEDLAAMVRAHDNRCAICKTPFTLVRMNVDHCHASGAVRGLLCGGCNRGLSCFQDDAKTMRRAIKYLADSAERCAPE